MKQFFHFEELWEEAEKLQSSSPAETKNQICDDLIKLIEDYKSLSYDKLTKDLFRIFATKKLGEIVFKICKLSLIDNINSFQSLFDEIKDHSNDL